MVASLLLKIHVILVSVISLAEKPRENCDFVDLIFSNKHFGNKHFSPPPARKT